MNEYVFEAAGLVYHYRQSAALRGVSLNIRAGQRVALLGANGSGKSTLLRILAGLYAPQQGSLRYRGIPVTEEAFQHEEFAHAYRRSVGLVFQDPDMQLFCNSVFDEIAFGPLQLGYSREQTAHVVQRALEAFQLEGLKDRAPHLLSGGEKKQTALASVLAVDPEVLLLDEPTAALDPRSQARMVNLLDRWHDEGRSLVVATHDLPLAARMADYCCVMNQGQVAAWGRVDEILADRELLERVNLVDAGFSVPASPAFAG